jgi:hypothetical protein
MAGLFELLTASANRLCYKLSNGEIISAPDESSLPSVLLYIPTSAARIAFLLTDQIDKIQLFVSGIPGKDYIMPVRIRTAQEAEEICICHHINGAFLSVSFNRSDASGETITFNDCDAGESERFQLRSVDLMSNYPELHSTLVQIQYHSAHPLTGPSILARMESGIEPVNGTAFAAVGRLLPQDQFDWLGSTILERPLALENLARTFPADIFAQVALPELSYWLKSRSEKRAGKLVTGWDYLAEVGLDGSYVSFPHMCNAHARRLIPAHKDVGLLATARNEGLYLLEWIAYHRSIGFQDILLYSNNNNDGSDQLLAALAAGGAIKWVQNEVAPGNAAQPKAYGHALGVSPDVLNCRWTLIIDLDEFFVFDSTRFSSISEYIAFQEARPVDAIALNWLAYGSSGEACWREAPMLSRFVHRFPWIDSHVKTLVRSNLPLQSRPHHPSFDKRQTILTRDASGTTFISSGGLSFSALPEASTAWINHYFLKSADEFIWKFSRNRGDYAMVDKLDSALIEDQFAEMFINQHASQAVVHDDRIAGCATGMPDEFVNLRRLPGVVEAEKNVRAEFHRNVANLKHSLFQEIRDSSADGPRQRFIKAIFGSERVI